MRRWERLLLRQQIIHCDLSDFLAVEDQRDHLSGLVNIQSSVFRGLASASRFAVHLNLTVDEINDPVDWNALAGVQWPLEIAVVIERRVGDLNSKADVL